VKLFKDPVPRTAFTWRADEPITTLTERVYSLPYVFGPYGKPRLRQNRPTSSPVKQKESPHHELSSATFR
jgi:hypothetical protein